MRRLILSIYLFLGLIAAQAQEMHQLIITHMDIQHDLPKKHLPLASFPDSLALWQGIENFIDNLHRKGYLLAQVDSITTTATTHEAFLVSGPLFSWHVTETNIDPAILKLLKLETYIGGKPIPYQDILGIKQRLVAHYENHGFPFARIVMDQVVVHESSIKGKLIADLMEFVIFDTLQLKGNVELGAAFVASHTGIRHGQAFSQDAATRVAASLADLPFLRLTGQAVLEFSHQKARLTFPVEARKANRLDGIIGLSGSGMDTDPYRLNGLVHLLLNNALERGETFDMQWQAMGQGTQRLILKARYPYIFSTPLITGMLFSLHKQDSSYISLRRRPEFAYRTQSNTLITAFADIRSTDLLNTSRFAQQDQRPSQMDTRITLYGMEFWRQTPGFPTSFRQGFTYGLSMAAGNRNIKQNTALNPDWYQGIELRQTQITTTLDAEIRYPFSDNISIVTQLESSALFGKQLFENELFRIGGFKSLKGFDEESIFASSFGILTQEMRFFTGEMSFVSLLYNIAWFEKDIAGQYLKGWPWAGGAGISLSTTPGILSVYYAIGKYPGVPMSFRNGRIHFGFISLF